MSIPSRSSPETPDFIALWQCFEHLLPGQKAELRRVETPDDLTLTPSLYRLFPGIPIRDRHLRLAFFLPWLSHQAGAANFASQLGKEKVAEARIFQVARAQTADDLIQLRRLAMQIKPKVDWAEFGKTLWYWGAPAKRKFVEDYYLAQFTPAKGERQ